MVADAVAKFYEAKKAQGMSDKRGFDLISDVLPFGRLWYVEVSDAIDYAKHRSRSHHAIIRVYDEAGNVIDDAQARRGFQRVVSFLLPSRRTSL
jgi:hypothetical protein